MNKSDHHFTKVERLVSKTVIKEVFEKGKQFFLFPFKVFYAPNHLGYNRVLISVPKRAHKRAVARNLIKRRIREAYRLNDKRNIQVNFFDINIVYISNNISDFEQINDKLSDVLERIQKDSTKADFAAVAVSD
ncbi:MAG: ribonuclease P protein component [Bacteroidales bacterium]|nr:ribonuclease P protein component [Bacteroidales bacterium]